MFDQKYGHWTLVVWVLTVLQFTQVYFVHTLSEIVDTNINSPYMDL